MRVFLSYEQPLRTRRTAIQMAATFAVSCVALAVGIYEIVQTPDEPGFLGIGGVIVGIVAFVIGSALLWSFATGAVHRVCVSDQGVFYDGKQWAWDSVLVIRSRPVLPNGTAHLSVSVKQESGFRLTLPIEITAAEPETVVEELKDYLNSSGHHVRWQSSGP